MRILRDCYPFIFQFVDSAFYLARIEVHISQVFYTPYISLRCHSSDDLLNVFHCLLYTCIHCALSGVILRSSITSKRIRSRVPPITNFSSTALYYITNTSFTNQCLKYALPLALVHFLTFLQLIKHRLIFVYYLLRSLFFYRFS